MAHAEPLLQRALALREAALGPSHPDVADSLNRLANLYGDRGLYGQAEPLYQRSLAIREAALGPNHLDVATSLYNLAVLYSDQGLYSQAESLHQRVLALREAALGPSHPDVANSLNSLATLYCTQALYDRAKPLQQRALTLLEGALGPSHPDVADSLNNLAVIYYQQGLYGRAEPLYQRALAVYKAALGPSHPNVARSLDGLAVLYSQQGLYGQAEPLYQSALTLREAALGPSHPSVALSFNNLAALYSRQGLHGRAEPLYQHALALREAALGPSHPDVAHSLNNLAALYYRQGLYGRAEPLYQRALALREAALGPSHPDVADSLNNLAALYNAQGWYGRAEPLYQRALALREAALGPSHPNVADSLDNLARFRLAQHRLVDALPLFTRAFSISEQRLRQEALDFSESRLSDFLLYLRSNEETLYSLLRAHSQNARVRCLVLSAVLLSKGRSVEETAHISHTIYRNLGAQERDTFERLRGLRTQLAALSTTGPASRSPADYQKRLNELADEGDSLEADLAKRSAPLRALSSLPGPEEVVDRVAASLPKDGALVEFIAYKDIPLISQPNTPPAATLGKLRYLALVLFPNGSTRAVDLGPAAPIDSIASHLRDALADRDACDVSCLDTAQALYKLAFKPLRSLLGTTRRILLSPDGRLGLVSFAALHDGHDFLLDSFDFTYLTSGRELLSHSQEPSPASVVVFANPNFSTAPPSSSSSAPSSIPPSDSLERFFSSPPSGLSRNVWKELEGTQEEAQNIRGLLPQAQLFLGSEASKRQLLHLLTPGILHLATHGFFLEDTPEAAPSPSTSRAPVQPPYAPGGLPLSIQDPMLRSGLVLAGARAAAPDAYLVTALELAGLNLWGTQLVILSACDTGRGQVRVGQGIYGLRRSLVIAGAETVVMSLWKVNDKSTSQLMKFYYQNLLAGQGRASALREAMRSLRATHPEPHFWAPFIALGSDAPLRAIAPSAPEGEASGTAP